MPEAEAGRTDPMILMVQEAEPRDAGCGLARIDPDDMIRIGADVGDIVLIEGKKKAAAKLLPIYSEYRGKSIIQIDDITRENAGLVLNEKASVVKSTCSLARSVTLSPAAGDLDCVDWDFRLVSKLLEKLPVIQGNRVRVNLTGSGYIDFLIVRTIPRGVVLLNPQTLLHIIKNNGSLENRKITYGDIGGLRTEIQRIRELIELPLKHPEVFQKIGITPPAGILLTGPPGTGKTLIARAVAAESDAHFISVNGPEIINKFYGESEANLRSIFEEAAAREPAVIFIDEIDAIAPKRSEVAGEVEKRVVGQLLTLMDGLERRRRVIVIGATNIPDAIDTALRRPGRFDREILIGVPDKNGRKHILQIHTREMPLAEDVDLTKIADMTYGFVGADLNALCREAGMSAVRETLAAVNTKQELLPYEALLSLKVGMDHFHCALGEVEPSAIREVFVEIPNTCWDDIGGLQEVKAALVRSIEWPLKYKNLFQHVKACPPKGILLAGPPGTGKTLIAKAVATESNANFISVKGPALFSKWVGESEKRLREVFKKAKQAAPCIIFFDEIDSMSCGRAAGESDSGSGPRIISQLLTEMDGVEELNGVIILAATNRIDLVDPALLRQGRFDHVFHISLPNEQERVNIFAIHLKDRPVSLNVNLMELSQKTGGLVGADIHGICQKASIRAIERFLSEGKKSLQDLVIQADDIYWAIEDLFRMKSICYSGF